MSERSDTTPTSGDLHSAASELAGLIGTIDDACLVSATPCAGWTVRDLLTHIRGFAAASTAAARRRPFPPDAPELVDPLEDNWRDRLPKLLDQLALAWSEPSAWLGTTEAAGIATTAEVAGSVALQELVLHGCDLAQATDQPFRPDPHAVRACLGFIDSLSDAERSSVFGPRRHVSVGAGDLDRLLAVTGRG